jgi:hypothetical protein
VINRLYRGAPKTKHPQIQWLNEEMGKRNEQSFLQGKSQNG